MDYPDNINRIIDKWTCAIGGKPTIVNHDITQLLNYIDQLKKEGDELRWELADATLKTINVVSGSGV